MARFLETIEVPAAQSNKEAVNLGQVKDLINRHMKEPVKVATTGELTGTYADNVLTLDTDITKIDNVALTEGDAVLVKDQLDTTQNGIYVVTKLGTAGTPSNAAVGVTGTVTNATINVAAFETQLGTPTSGVYNFTYDGVTDNAWKLDGAVVALADYGITETLTGTDPVDGDAITVTYTESVAGVGGELTRREDFEEGKVILNNTFVNVMEGDTCGDSRWTIVSDGVLTVGTSSIIFVKDNEGAATFKVVKTEITGDGVTTEFEIPHNFNLTDPDMYQITIKDVNKKTCYVGHKPTDGKEANSITLSFTVVPAVGEVFKVILTSLE